MYDSLQLVNGERLRRRPQPGHFGESHQLARGTYTGTVTITATAPATVTNTPQTVAVTLKITSTATLNVSASSLSFTQLLNSPRRRIRILLSRVPPERHVRRHRHRQPGFELAGGKPSIGITTPATLTVSGMGQVATRLIAARSSSHRPEPPAANHPRNVYSNECPDYSGEPGIACAGELPDRQRQPAGADDLCFGRGRRRSGLQRDRYYDHRQQLAVGFAGERDGASKHSCHHQPGRTGGQYHSLSRLDFDRGCGRHQFPTYPADHPYGHAGSGDRARGGGGPEAASSVRRHWFGAEHPDSALTWGQPLDCRCRANGGDTGSRHV